MVVAISIKNVSWVSHAIAQDLNYFDGRAGLNPTSEVANAQ